MTRHFFSGGNTPSGFCNRFNYIPFNGERTIHLKGASGCGKSTFMKKTAATFQDRGFATELFHCSNDAESLDGICIPKAGFCIVDGTAPHVSDPGVPVAHDELFNMAEFIDAKAVLPYKQELFELMDKKKQAYTKSYNYLAAAYAVHKNTVHIYQQALDSGKLFLSMSETLSIFDRICPTGKAGRKRKLFATAITPDGFVNFTPTLINTKTVYILQGESGSGTEIFLEQIQEAACLRGFDSEGLYCPLCPSKLEHLIIPELELCFTTENSYHSIESHSYTEKICFSSFLDQDIIVKHQQEIDYNTGILRKLIEKAIHTLLLQRSIHDRIEKIYLQGMDFDRLTQACDGIIDSLLKDISLKD